MKKGHVLGVWMGRELVRFGHLRQKLENYGWLPFFGLCNWTVGALNRYGQVSSQFHQQFKCNKNKVQ